ncbi:MAG: EamA family transporter [Microgenomates group bacterium]
MDWKLFAVIAPLLLVCYQTLAKLVPKDTPSLLVNAYMLLVGAITMFLLYITNSPSRILTLPMKTFWIVVGIGLCVSLANYSIIKAYSLGAPQSAFSSIFNPLYIIFGILFGIVIWHEKLSMQQIIGIGFALVGMFLIIDQKK